LVKSRFLILEVLDIDLKFSEKRLLTLATLSICIMFLLALFCIFLVQNLEVIYPIKITLFVGIFIIFLFCIYLLIYYLLAPMFKTNYLLELLLKDTLHELNIPLSVIKANLQLLHLDEQNEKKLKQMHRISLACVDLDRLYHDMDYYIKREVRYDLKEEFDIKTVVDEELEKIKAQGLEVKVVNKVHSLHVKGDKRGFSKILSNLIDNAIKYTNDEKTIQIELNNAKLSVIDNGIGMDEGELFQVFDRYYQTNSDKKGAGIGLSIVKAYCDEEKIFINIFSKKGRGTEVVLDLKNIISYE